MSFKTSICSVHKSSLARHQANAVDFATKVCFSLFDGSEEFVTDVVYKGEIVQHVTPQKHATCLVYRQTYVHRNLGYLLIVAVHYGSYLRADTCTKLLICFDLHTFFF